MKLTKRSFNQLRCGTSIDRAHKLLYYRKMRCIDKVTTHMCIDNLKWDLLIIYQCVFLNEQMLEQFDKLQNNINVVKVVMLQYSII